jgi:hypothetical protein
MATIITLYKTHPSWSLSVTSLTIVIDWYLSRCCRGIASDSVWLVRNIRPKAEGRERLLQPSCHVEVPDRAMSGTSI